MEIKRAKKYPIACGDHDDFKVKLGNVISPQVYLTALVYVPAKREIASGLSDVPVVCTTVERQETGDCGDWASCGEWCLGSRASHCVKLWASVRRNGTDLALVGCDRVRDITCTVRKIRKERKGLLEGKLRGDLGCIEITLYCTVYSTSTIVPQSR